MKTSWRLLSQDALDRANAVMGSALTPREVKTHVVRDVAPNKPMLCLSFLAPDAGITAPISDAVATAVGDGRNDVGNIGGGGLHGGNDRGAVDSTASMATGVRAPCDDGAYNGPKDENVALGALTKHPEATLQGTKDISAVEAEGPAAGTKVSGMEAEVSECDGDARRAGPPAGAGGDSKRQRTASA